MYCDKANVNILSSLLPQAGIRDVVVCPGSRNALLVHNFYLMSQATDEHRLRVHPVTDERSATFAVIGLSLASHSPACVCVTSGSALLNTLPAVAEAFYRQVPLLVISADRPRQWIGQLDGQTIEQDGALCPYAQTYTLNETSSEESIRQCFDTAVAALSALHYPHSEAGRPVHVNVPISEPLFSFTTPKLPDSSISLFSTKQEGVIIPDSLVAKIASARLPLLVIGQWDTPATAACAAIEEADSLLVLPELISNLPNSRRTAAIEQHPELISSLCPDLVVHVGGNFVNKQLKLALRRLPRCVVIRVEETYGTPDTFQHLAFLIRGSAKANLEALGQARLPRKAAVTKAKQILAQAAAAMDSIYPAPFSQEGIMRCVADFLHQHCISLTALHLANSTVVRMATRAFAEIGCPIYCNRGVNGIEGSLSVAAGHALGCPGLQLALIGDLSFFYDQNALWNQALGANLRIILFNNGGGRIFDTLPGLERSPARDTLIAASHATSARGIAESYHIHYHILTAETGMAEAIAWLLSARDDRPSLLEIKLGGGKNNIL